MKINPILAFSARRRMRAPRTARALRRPTAPPPDLARYRAQRPAAHLASLQPPPPTGTTAAAGGETKAAGGESQAAPAGQTSKDTVVIGNTAGESGNLHPYNVIAVGASAVNRNIYEYLFA